MVVVGHLLVVVRTFGIRLSQRLLYRRVAVALLDVRVEATNQSKRFGGKALLEVGNA